MQTSVLRKFWKYWYCVSLCPRLWVVLVMNEKQGLELLKYFYRNQNSKDDFSHSWINVYYLKVMFRQPLHSKSKTCGITKLKTKTLAGDFGVNDGDENGFHPTECGFVHERKKLGEEQKLTSFDTRMMQKNCLDSNNLTWLGKLSKKTCKA